MLAGLYVPSDIEPRDADPRVTSEEKLKIIHRSQVRISSSSDDGHFVARLPYGIWAGVYLPLPSTRERYAWITDIFAGDPSLHQKGIGSRLMRAVITEAVKRDPTVNCVVTGWARLGVVNTLIRVLGEENVSVTNNGRTFGMGTERPLEELLEFAPPHDDGPYVVYSTKSRIDPVVIKAWEPHTVIDNAA